MPLMMYLHIYNKKDDNTSKEIQEDLVKQQVAKTAQDIFMGLGSWDSAAKEHMMIYDKQLKTLQRCMTRKQFFEEGYEQLVAHSYI